MADNNKSLRKILLIPIVAFAIFIVPILNQAIQIDIQNATGMIPTHWQFVVSAVAGGLMSTVVSIMRKYFDTYKEEIDKEVEKLKNELEKKDLERDISEKEIMLTAARGNDTWLKSNDQIEELNKQISALEEQLKKKE